MWGIEYMGRVPGTTLDLAAQLLSTLTDDDDGVDVETANDRWLKFAGEATGADSVRFVWRD